jgi:beta-glucanase (GH16 family)
VDTELYSSCHVHVPVPFTFNAGTQTTVANMGASMHTYSVIWKQDSITWLFDNKEVFSYSNTTGNIPHTPMFLIMDNAVGGVWGGPPDSTSIFPQSMDIDSVHVVSLS